MAHRAWRTHRSYRPDDHLVSRRALLIGGATVFTTGAAWAYSNGSPTEQAGRSSDQSQAASTTAASTTTTTPPPAPRRDQETVAAPPLTHALTEGMAGGDIERLQQRLTDLAFDPGPVDGFFGPATLRSVWAFEKLVLGVARADATGVITPESWRTLFGDITVAPRRTPGGTHMEVYLPEQVSVLFAQGTPRVISHVSSGEGIVWCDEVEIDLDDGTTEAKGICGKSVTPGGVYHFDRKIDGWRNAKLGRLYKPVYFNYGIAIHGATNVPNHPASRGCVRHPMHIAEYLPDLISIGDHIFVFDGVEEPETYGAQPMVFDWPDPDWTPPTTTTSTTTTTTSTAPSATAAPTTATPSTVAPTTAPPTAPLTPPSPTTAPPTTTVP